MITIRKNQKDRARAEIDDRLSWTTQKKIWEQGNSKGKTDLNWNSSKRRGVERKIDWYLIVIFFKFWIHLRTMNKQSQPRRGGIPCR
jgi:hypothetical protein